MKYQASCISNLFPALFRYGTKLQKTGALPKNGWTKGAKVSFGLEISQSGEIKNIIDLREEITEKKKKGNEQSEKARLVPARMDVPFEMTRSSNVLAYFLCDNSKFLLGINDKKSKCFPASSKLHHDILGGVDSPAAKAILAFYDKWNPNEAESHPKLGKYWDDLEKGSNLIFFYRHEPVTECPKLCSAWNEYYNKPDPDEKLGTCMVTGEENTPIARTHPFVKYLYGALATGASIISANFPSLTHYGKTQGDNGPVSKRAIETCIAALNALLTDDRHRKTLGKVTVVCWTDNGSEDYQDVAEDVVFGIPKKNGDKNKEDGKNSEKITGADLANFLEALTKGKMIDINGIQLDPDEKFYMLGLSANGGRVVIEFFYENVFSAYTENIAKHYNDIAITRPSYDNREFLSMWQLIAETKRKNEKWDKNDSRLYFELFRAIVFGSEYPEELKDRVLERIYVERKISRGKAAILKGYYLRSKHNNFPREVLQMELNKNSVNVPYTLGRIFAVVEGLQYKVNPTINKSVKDKYYARASECPSSVFPVLNNMSEIYISKLKSKRTTQKAGKWYSDYLRELQLKIGERYPTALTDDQRGAFQLGYYHETEARFKKDSDDNGKGETNTKKEKSPRFAQNEGDI